MISTTWFHAPATLRKPKASPIRASASSSPLAFRSALPAPPTCCASPISIETDCSLREARASDGPLLAVNLLKRALDAVHVRIEAQCLLKGGARCGEIALLALDHAAPGESAEMARLQFEHLV